MYHGSVLIVGKIIVPVAVTILTCFLTYSMERVFLEKLTGFQLVKKFPAYCGTWRFITAVTSARHLFLT